MRLSRRPTVFVFCLLLILASRSAAREPSIVRPELVGLHTDKVLELSKFMQSLVADGKIAGGVTLMACQGKLIHLQAVGMADWEQKTPMHTDAIFRIASMSKPITSVAVMKLYEQGKLGLDDPLSKFIPEFKTLQVLVNRDPARTEPARREITIRQLLTHTSGLGYSFSKTLGPIYCQHNILAGLSVMPDTLQQAVKRLAEVPLLFQPGDGWEYSMATDVLGRVIEVASGQPLDRFIQQEICRPLAMNDTFFQVPPEKRTRLAAAYVPVDGSIRKLRQGETLRYTVGGNSITISPDYVTSDANRYRSGGGGLCSTATDYMRFCQMLLGGGQLDGVRLLRADTVRLMTTNQTQQVHQHFGFGFDVTPDARDIPKPLRTSYAWSGFWSTFFRVAPRGDWIVVTMTQLATNASTGRWYATYDKLAAEALQP